MKALLLGNAAVARGAWEASVAMGCGYPGTPSTEILEHLGRYKDVLVQWAPNEKVAYEVAMGVSLSGHRALVTMKHVGLNVAADPFFSSSYMGVNGGLVVACADDPGMHSSQDEQDNRHFARAARVLMVEPADAAEARWMTAAAFSLSERFDTPVLLRLTTRVCHQTALVELGDPPTADAANAAGHGYRKNIAKNVLLPGHARQRRLVVEERMAAATAFSNESDLWNPVHRGTSSVGVVTSGVAFGYVREVLPDASVLKIGLSYPIPIARIRSFAATVERLYVMEELDPFLEDAIRAAGIPVEGSSLRPFCGELNLTLVEAAFRKASEHGCTNASLDAESVATPLEASPDAATPGASPDAATRGASADAATRGASPEAASPAASPLGGTEVPPRPPTLCPGCGHRGMFSLFREMKLRVMGDIGCYTLGALKPLAAMDACLCMGASIGMAHGLTRFASPEDSSRTVAVIGDSTFFHSGIPSLLDMIVHGSNATVVILDNRWTAMTGAQPNPGTGLDVNGKPAPRFDIPGVCRALGVRRVREIDPYQLEECRQALEEELAAPEVSVIVSYKPCLLGTPRPAIAPAVTIDLDACDRCGACIRVGCMALHEHDGYPTVDSALCTGCQICLQVCEPHAISVNGFTGQTSSSRTSTEVPT